MRVLMAVYACEPDTGSEPGVGWNWALQAAKHGHEVDAITRANNRSAIEAHLATSPIPGLRFHYLDLPKPFLWAKRRFGYYGLLSYYYAWQVALHRLAKQLHASHPYEVAHHVTFVNDWLPSGLAGLGIPFIWGPVGGSTHIWPSQIAADLPTYARRYECIRKWTIRFAKKLDPLVRATRRDASLILAYTRETLDGFTPAERSRARAIVHIGMSSDDIPQLLASRNRGPGFQVVTGGRLVHWKGFDLLIEAFARFHTRHETARLVITGEGRYRPYLQALVDSLGLGGSVDFRGLLATRHEVLQLITDSDIYALPTLRDGPPVGILEAMAMSSPILCLDIGATAELVPQTAGIKVAVVNREQVIADLSEALDWAAKHGSELDTMGKAARQYTHRVHSWEAIGASLNSLYHEVLASGND